MPSSPVQIREIDLEAIHLEQGAHSSQQQFCVMELTAYLAHEPWSDHPKCASPAISAFLRAWNDSVDDAFRQQLKPYAVKVIGTATTPEHEQTRAWMAMDWMVRTVAPAWLDLAGLTEQASKLRALDPLTSDEIAIAVQDLLDQVREEASAAWSAAESAARSAARSAAWSAAESAAESAARSAAEAKVAPVVAPLQASAFELLDRMIAVGKLEVVAV